MEYLPHLGRGAVVQKDAPRIGVRRQFRHRHLPGGLDDFRHRISPPGKVNGGLEEILPRSRPKRWCSFCQPDTQPGTVTEWMPSRGMEERPRDFRKEMFSPAGAQPLPLRPVSVPVLASQQMANRSPPMPLLIGSTTPRVALAAMAASTAEPPRASTCAPACEASVWLVAAIPIGVMTMERACARPG